MLLEGGHSGLVRLSDSLKTGLSLCARSSSGLLRLVRPHLSSYQESQRLAREALAGKLDTDKADSRIREVLSAIPDDVARNAAYLHGHEIHTLSLSALFLSCFCLESYINTLAYFLFQEGDFLSLVKHGHRSSAEVLIDAIAKMTIREKWKTVGRLRDAKGFDVSRPPFQDFQILFRFRDDHVHDKVISWEPENAKSRYNGKFPEGAAYPLDLGHALYGAETYWKMVQEVHRLTGIEKVSFHRHYNLRPWMDDRHYEELKEIATDYRNTAQPR